MNILHRITFGHKDNVESSLRNLNIDFTKSDLPGDGYLIHLNIYESNPIWPKLEKIVQMKNALDIYDTEFSDSEILSSEWVRLIPTYEYGYPFPSNKWQLNHPNYATYCPDCGSFKQIKPFTIEKKFDPNKYHFVCLYWTYTLFTNAEVLDTLSSNNIIGFEKWDALIGINKTSSQSIRQMYIPYFLKPGIVFDKGHKSVNCSSCSTQKYFPHRKGRMRILRDSLDQSVDILKSSEWFGSGHAAYQEIFISNKLARLIIENGWSGVRMKSVNLV